MADKQQQWADSLSAGQDGRLSGFLAEEGPVDRRLLWRLGSWGVAAVGAVVVAVLASQSQIRLHRDQFAASDMLNRQAQQIQFVAKETQTEAKRLSQAIDTLNSDRDRLFTRMTSIEQGLETVTGSIKHQPPVVTATPPAAPGFSAAASTAPVPFAPTPTAPIHLTPMPAVPAPAAPEPASQAAAELPSIPVTTPAIGPVASVEPIARPAAPPEAANKPAESAPHAATAATPPAEHPPTPPAIVQASAEPAASPEVAAVPVPRTEFGVDIGGANSVDGLRAIWRAMSRTKSMAGLRPIMTVKERGTGLGMQLRLVAGPLTDAAAAARICAMLAEGKRPCETTVFDGQRLALRTEAAPAEHAAPPPVRLAPRKRPVPKPEQRTEQVPPKPAVEEPAPAPPPKPQSPLSSLLGIRQ